MHSRISERVQRQRDEMRRDVDVWRTLVGRGLKRGTHLPRLPMEFPASSMLHDSFRRTLQRGIRTRALVSGGLKQNVSSQATRCGIWSWWTFEIATHAHVENALALSSLSLSRTLIFPPAAFPSYLPSCFRKCILWLVIFKRHDVPRGHRM